MSNAFKKSLGRLAFAVHKQQRVKPAVEATELFLSSDGVKVLEAIPNGASLHRANGEILWVSLKTADLVNDTAEALIGKLAFDGINPQDRPKVFQAFADCCSNQQARSIDFRLQAYGSDKVAENRNFELQLSPFKYRDQTLALAILKEVQAPDDQIIEPLTSTRLARISHELRTPLNAINGFSQMLMSEGDFAPDNQKRVEYAKLISQSSLHLLELVNDILDNSKEGLPKTSISKELFDLAREIEDVLKQLAPIAHRAGVDIRHEIDECLPRIFADKRAIRQILINLVSNAVKFSGKGKTVTVKATRSLKTVSLYVLDDGIGMSRDSLSRLGEEYYQAKSPSLPPTEGTGLGLSIVRELVEMHEGIVDFQSVQGKGTTVKVELPISSGASTPVPSNPEQEIVYLNKSREPNLLRRLDTGHTIRRTG